jgi:SpoVK/Ycf46/Vps4 family AAA+-type ATPase
MMANAIASKLKKKVLLINFPALGLNSAGFMIKLLFREARIKKAILFFDECESLFHTRDKGGSTVNTCLSELERFEDMCILATNRAYDLDEAMFRRISLAVEFKKPDHILREHIWKTLRPEKLGLEDDVDYKELARKYELAGGFIKNFWLSSVSLMVSRDGEKVSQADLEQAASEQLVGQLHNDQLDRHVVATCGVDSVIASSQVKKSLKDIVDHKKSQSVLFSQWGFDKIHRAQSGVSVLLHGPPGTGKSLAAEAISFDIGSPLMVVNTSELVNKYVGETGKNITSVFRDAKHKGAVLVFDEGEGLFGHRSKGNGSSVSRHDDLNVGLLLQHIEHFSGVCIVITNHSEAIDEAFFRRFNYVLKFEFPSARLREQLWRSLLPKECPLASDISLSVLANRFEMCGGDIKSALLRAASRAALREKDVDRIVTMKDLEQSCQEEVEKRSDKTSANIYI